MKKHLVVAAAMAAVFSAVPAIAGVNIYITPPAIPVPVLPPPPVPVMVMPPPPPGVVIGPSYWYWDGDRGSWFYYDRYRHPHYDRRHGFVNDGRHFYSRAAGGGPPGMTWAGTGPARRQRARAWTWPRTRAREKDRPRTQTLSRNYSSAFSTSGISYPRKRSPTALKRSGASVTKYLM